eukprot:g1632.t1
MADAGASGGDGGEGGGTITIRVKASTGEETFFKVKKTTKMSKIFGAYANRQGVQLNSLKFMLDGERVNPEDTPKTLELEDQDQIDAFLEQVGGADAAAADGASADNKAGVKDEASTITIRVKASTGEETFFKVKNTTKMGKIMKAYATRLGVEQKSLRFLLDGDRIQEDDTPDGLDLEDQDQLDVVLEQTGGF